MDETNTSTTTIITTRTKSSTNNSNTSGGNSGANNMETKSINIPTNAQHAQNKSRSSSISETREATTISKTVSGQSNTTTKTPADGEVADISGNCNSSCGNVNISESKHGENGVCGRSGKCESIGEPDIGINTSSASDQHHGNPPNISSHIDPLKESTKTLACDQKFPSDQVETKSSGPLPSSVTSSSSVQEGEKADLENKISSCDSNSVQLQRKFLLGEGAEQESDNKGALTSTISNKPPVPNFRVEGSGAGDSSITVAVASLSSAVSASVTLHSSGGGRGGSTGGSNSLENGEQPGSSSGPVSIQSSEEMRLSLVSWYSEPDDPSRLIEGCCSALNTYRHENGIVEEVVDCDRDICGRGGSMGHEVISSVTNNISPVCKSESEEKENKTPEPCGNIDKMSGAGVVDNSDDCKATFTKSELVNPNPNDNTKNSECGNSFKDNSRGEINNQDESQSQVCQSLADRHSGGEAGANYSVKLNTSTSSNKCVDIDKCVKHSSSSSQRVKTHVQVSEHKFCSTPSQPGGHASRCHRQDGKPDCPRCSRRSKSGTTTPASGNQIARTRTPASRRVVQSSKSSTEIKKPIKSILKHDSRGSAGSGSGSDKQSSMDSLGSSGDIGVTPVHILRGRMPNTLMTRSDSGTRARFNFSNTNTCVPDTPTGAPEDKAVSKLKRIEKYATLRVRKPLKPRPLELSDSETHPNDVHNGVMSSSNHGVTGVPGAPNELMSKSMSYLEKASSNRVHISTQGHPYGESTSASSTLKRQGSLRLKKQCNPQWEPSGTRTSALRLQKMQAAKAKNSPGGGASSGSANSGSAHSGSGDSLHYLPHSANSTSASGGSSGMGSIHLSGAHSAPSAHSRMNATAAAKEKHMGAKIFSKLSSATGQTASSNQKRLKQERGVQTDVVAASATIDHNVRMSLSPVPALDSGAEATEQIKNLERLCNRYRNQVMKIQSDLQQSESNKIELSKQLEETQHESNEMIEFLTAEKSTLAESLTEVEVEARKWKDEIDAVKRDYQSRCSSLVRLSEQHKQEALKSQALLHRLESQSTSVISQLSHQITDGAQNVLQTRQRVTALTDSLLKTYKVPPELLASSEANQAIKETDLSCSLLLPLITSLSAAFPMVTMESLTSKPYSTTTTTGNMSALNAHVVSSSTASDVDTHTHGTSVKVSDPTHNLFTSQCTSLTLTESSSLQSLNQAILEREAAEKSGLDDIKRPFSLIEGVSPDADQLSLRKEITELNAAIAKLLSVVRVIVIHCDRKVSSVASSILQCLKSIEDDKVGNIAEIAQVQKSLEAWSDKGASSGSSSSTSNGSPPCKSTISSTTVGTTAVTTSSYLVGNGHAHV